MTRRPLPVDLDPKDFPSAKRHREARWGVVWLIVAGLLIWSGRCAVAAALMSGG